MDRQAGAESVMPVSVDYLSACLWSGSRSQSHCKAFPCLGNKRYAALLGYVRYREVGNDNAFANSRQVSTAQETTVPHFHGHSWVSILL